MTALNILGLVLLGVGFIFFQLAAYERGRVRGMKDVRDSYQSQTDCKEDIE